MYDYLIILPNQLFKFPANVVEYNKIIVVEHPNYFTRYYYHINKLILHRATMKSYASLMQAEYVDCADYKTRINDIFSKCKNIAIFDPIDHDIFSEFNAYAKTYDKDLAYLDNPNFLCMVTELIEYDNANSKVSHKSFYTHFRKKFNILMENGRPKGDKWSYDTDNRLKFPNNYVEAKYTPKYNPDEKRKILAATKYARSVLSDEGKKYLNEVAPFYLPINYVGAKKQFDYFVANSLNNFGPYEDAMRSDVDVGYHSVLSPILNIGLIDLEYVISAVTSSKACIESVEGFIRQLFWREYCRFIYIFKINPLITKNSYFTNKRELHHDWFTCKARTMMPNIDNCIEKFAKYGYLHHIERLMCIGNFMLITEINIKDVFNWFMMFVDAYTWVMFPNVFGMSQYNAGPLMTKRPYFSASNYITKMSNYKSGSPIVLTSQLSVKAFDIWDALYYRFVDKYKKQLAKNYSTANAVNLWRSKTLTEKARLLYIAKIYLKNYL